MRHHPRAMIGPLAWQGVSDMLVSRKGVRDLPTQ